MQWSVSISNIYKNILFCNNNSRVAQWKRAGPITQRSVDRNYALLNFFGLMIFFHNRFPSVRMAEWSKAPDSRHSLASLIGGVVRILVLVWGRGFKSHFWQKFCLTSYLSPSNHKMSTTSCIPRRSPIQVLTRLNVA